MRILVTGASGFVGPYLCRELRGRFHDAEIVATSTAAGTPEWAQSLRVEWTAVDLGDTAAVNELVSSVKPTHLVHLAAQSHVPTAQRLPRQTWVINLMASLDLLEAINACVPECWFLQVGSGDIYGRSFRTGRALSEDALPQPENPYSASKAAAEIMVRQYGFQGLRTICLRSFNHVGAGQRPDFVISAFARQIALVEAGLQSPVITVGNLDAWRDFSDVRDVVRAYADILDKAEQIEPSEIFNVCSGRPRQIRSILDDLIDASNVSIRVRQDPERLRPSDTPFAAGDPTHIRETCGWQPTIPWEKTIRDVLDFWRAEIQKSR